MNGWPVLRNWWYNVDEYKFVDEWLPIIRKCKRSLRKADNICFAMRRAQLKRTLIVIENHTLKLKYSRTIKCKREVIV